MIDKKLLINSVKTTAAWALSTAVMAAPVALLGNNPVQSYAFGYVAMGAYVPLLLLFGTRFRGVRDVAGLYVVLYDVVHGRICDMVNRTTSKTK